MARARNIKPSFFSNEVLASLPPLARLLFAGLWTIADREGRLEDRPLRIKRDVLPYDNCDVDELLEGLSVTGFIVRYEVCGNKYIQINTFKKHQNPHIKEPASSIPEPESPVLAPDKTGNIRNENGSSPADSLNPLTDSLNRIPSTSGTLPERGNRFDYESRFGEVWNLYPQKGRVKIHDSQRFYIERVSPRPEETHARIIETLSPGGEWAESDQFAKGFVPGLPEWLRNSRWLEHPSRQGESHTANGTSGAGTSNSRAARSNAILDEIARQA